jgi:hypothetical protein
VHKKGADENNPPAPTENLNFLINLLFRLEAIL